ncbi:hypothetical protein OIV83_002739 [Microbotryomycetes sp. JL201]|nr:hypothetical protein OIV83_002739 [Microbotryomycetes sp. JL201]
MPDLKALIKAKQASARLTHPNARYDARGQLSCNICHVQIKSAALFGPHLQSKASAHRSNVQKQQQQQQQQDAEGARVSGQKRKLDETGSDVDGQAHDSSDENATKRKRDDSQEQQDTQAGEAASSVTKGGLPSDFFADPSQAPVAQEQSDDEDDEVDGGAHDGHSTAEGDDPEWAAFEAALREGPTRPNDGPLTTAPSATISAAPVEYEFGAPKVEGEDDEQAPADDEEPETEETEEERLARIDREEKEEIMQRIEEEELEQKMADEKVSALKRKLEMMKAARKSKQTTKDTKDTKA